MVHSKSQVVFHITQSFNDFVGNIEVLFILFALAKFLQSSIAHPFHLIFSHSGKAFLLVALKTTQSSRKLLILIFVVMNELLRVARIVRSRQSLLQSHDRITGIFTGHMRNLTEHEVLDVIPLHTKIDHISLHIKPTSSCTALHLLCNQRCKSVAHVSTEYTRTEWHVDTVSKGIVRKDDSKTALLG